MFWAVTLESGKRYSQIVESSYHLSMAALEPTTKEINAGNKFVSVMIEHGKAEYLLCTLEYDRVMQVPLDLIFVEGEEVSFFLSGEGTVHLSGYIINDEDGSVSETQLSSELSNESEDDDEDDENYSSSRLMTLDDEDEEDSDDWTPQKESRVKMSVEKKRKLNESSTKISPENKSNSKKHDVSLEKNKVKKKGGSFREEKSMDIEENGSVNIENDEHIDADTGKRKKSFQDEKKCKKINLSNSLLGSADKRTDIKKSETEVIKTSPGNRQKNLSLKQEQESDEDENDDDDDDEEHGDDEHYMYESDDNEDDENEEEDDESEDSDSADDSDSNNEDQESSIGRTPMPSKKTKAILRSPLTTESKLHLPLGREINEIGTKREQNNEVKKTPENKSLKNSPKEKNQGERVPALIPIVKSKDKITTSTPKISKPEKKRLPGGVEISDFRIGSGPMAKPGKFVHVYYVGKLSNNKEFESVKQGQKPFAFRLGRGEVIKGWDLGIEGMKVGGKRQIVIPPSQGYGNKKQGQIPPNSTLIFDVELKAVS